MSLLHREGMFQASSLDSRLWIFKNEWVNLAAEDGPLLESGY
jgi:hypothetical protein